MTTEGIAWGVLGVLSFVTLIAYLRWEDPPKDQRACTPPELPNRQVETDADLSALLVPKATTTTRDDSPEAHAA